MWDKGKNCCGHRRAMGHTTLNKRTLQDPWCASVAAVAAVTVLRDRHIGLQVAGRALRSRSGW